MGIFDGIKNIAIRKFFEKYVKASVKSAVAFVSVWLAQNAGLELTAEQQTSVIVAAIGAVFAFTNQIKHKWPNQFGWL